MTWNSCHPVFNGEAAKAERGKGKSTKLTWHAAMGVETTKEISFAYRRVTTCARINIEPRPSLVDHTLGDEVPRGGPAGRDLGYTERPMQHRTAAESEHRLENGRGWLRAHNVDCIADVRCCLLGASIDYLHEPFPQMIRSCVGRRRERLWYGVGYGEIPFIGGPGHRHLALAARRRAWCGLQLHPPVGGATYKKCLSLHAAGLIRQFKRLALVEKRA